MEAYGKKRGYLSIIYYYLLNPINPTLQLPGSADLLWENLGTLVTELTNLAYEFSAWRVIA